MTPHIFYRNPDFLLSSLHTRSTFEVHQTMISRSLQFGRQAIDTQQTTQTKELEVPAIEIKTQPVPTASRDSVSFSKPKVNPEKEAAEKKAAVDALQRQLEAKQASALLKL